MEKRAFAVCVPLWLILIFCYFEGATTNPEVDALNAMKSNMIDPNGYMQTWDPNIVTPCTWNHITCVNDKVTTMYVVGLTCETNIELGNANLTGQLVPQLDQLTNLQNLLLSGNNINGAIPQEIGNFSNLVKLELNRNNLSGPIPSTLGKLSRLQSLLLNDNSLTGEIPISLTSISTLTVIDLSYNKLTGEVPINGSFSHFKPTSFIGNNLTIVAILPPTQAQLPPSSTQGNSATTKAILGGVFGTTILVATLAMALTYWQRRKHQDRFFDVPVEADPEVHSGSLKRFSFQELQVATDNFSNSNILGRGGFGNVYKGRLANGSLVAVKRLKEDCLTQGGELQFQAEVEMISMAIHRNLLRLRGFCMTPTERLLVYPYMVNGSLATCLRERPKTQAPLDWSVRKRIALGAARGLSYLHEQCNPKIIHRDVKAANILLDEEFEAIIGDFGLAKLMDYNETHVTTAVRGTIGHIAPEYLSFGKSSEKTDVFGYGIMLLELCSGQRAFDLAGLANKHDIMLLDWVKGLVREDQFEVLVDGDLQGNYVKEEVKQIIQVALLCTQSSPLGRPKMSEVAKMLEGDMLSERWEEWEKQETLRKQTNVINQPDMRWVFESTSTPQPDELSNPR